MISRFSKMIPGLLAVLAGAGLTTSCSLFKDGKYASQWEVETEVPESLDAGKPSRGPSAGEVASRAGSEVPATSNLTDLPALDSMAGLPGETTPSTNMDPGVAALPKPNFDEPVRRQTAEYLNVPPPGSTPTGVDTELPGTSAMPTLSEVPLEPLTAQTSVAVQTPAAPVALTDVQPAAVPLLHGEQRLSDFYAGLHQGLLEGDTVQNQAVIPDSGVPAPAPSTDATVPAPAPAPAPAQ